MKKAFTLLELLLVIAIIASLAGLIINALNPAQRLEEANETKYTTLANDIEKALEIYAVENGGNLPTTFSNLSYGYYEICKQGQSTNCINLDLLIPTYLPSIPEDTSDSSSVISGFKLKYDPTKKEVSVYSNSEYTAFMDNGSTLTDKLLGYWKMDEMSWNGTAGEVIDSSGNNNHGTTLNGVVTTAGKFGNGSLLDGIDDSVDLGLRYPNANLNFSFTTTVWVKFTVSSGYVFVLGDVNGGRGDTLIQNNRAQCRAWDSSEHVVTGTTNLNDGEWHQIVCVSESNSSAYTKLYVDGVEEGTIAFASTVGYNQNIKIGKGTSAGKNLFTGQVDDVRVYSRALNVDEVGTLYEWGPSPIAHLKFDECEGTTAYDSSGNENHGLIIVGEVGSQTLAGSCNTGNNGEALNNGTNGVYGASLNFDGTDDYVDLGDKDIFENPYHFTISLWMKTKAFGSGSSSNLRPIVSKWGTTYVAGGYMLQESNGRLNSSFSDGSDYSRVQTLHDINLGQWYHVAATFQNGTVYLYKDGKVLDYIDGPATQILNNTRTLKIGAWYHLINSSYKTFDGQIDDVRFYNYARTQEQILEDMNNE